MAKSASNVTSLLFLATCKISLPPAEGTFSVRFVFRGIGSDTVSFDVGSEPEGAVHTTIFAHNVWGLENLAHLGKVPPAGATVRTALKMKPELFRMIFFFFFLQASWYQSTNLTHVYLTGEHFMFSNVPYFLKQWVKTILMFIYTRSIYRFPGSRVSDEHLAGEWCPLSGRRLLG